MCDKPCSSQQSVRRSSIAQLGALVRFTGDCEGGTGCVERDRIHINGGGLGAYRMKKQLLERTLRGKRFVTFRSGHVFIIFTEICSPEQFGKVSEKCVLCILSAFLELTKTEDSRLQITRFRPEIIQCD